MKTMTCSELVVTCDVEFRANTFEGKIDLSKKYGMEMFKANDEVHLVAMDRMK